MIIDFHSHILPGADHGSDSLETSISQVELALSTGVDIILATPHFYPHKHKLQNFIKKRDEAYKQLCEKTDAKILLGAEVLLCEGLNRLSGLEELCIKGTKTLLLELPFTSFKDSYIYSVEQLIEDGYDIVLAHADRYSQQDIENLIAIGAKIQLNANALSKFIVKKHLRDWIKRGIVVAIGSDIHMIDKKAYSEFKKAKNKLKDSFFDIMKKSYEIIGKSNF